MKRIMIVECMQEISSFNPVPSDYSYFGVQRGAEMLAQRGLNTGVGGALEVFEAAAGIEVVPVYSARAGSAGLLSAAGWAQLSGELRAAVAASMKDIDGIYVSLHGAMGADGELDPEGWVLREVRALAGAQVPIVMSLDLHGILTDRMLRQVDGLAIYHTYPHVDFADTGARAARLLLKLMAGGVKGLGGGLVGSPATIAARIDQYAQIGVDCLMLRFLPAFEGMDRFARDVMPLLPDKGALAPA